MALYLRANPNGALARHWAALSSRARWLIVSGAERLGLLAAMRPPTDFKILKAIHDLYRDEYIDHVNNPKIAHHLKTYMPVDVTEVAKRLGAEPEIVFGRLYYHLGPKYGSEATDGTLRPFFEKKIRSDLHCVNFSLLDAVLAGLWQERRRDLLALATAALSLGIALASLFISIFVG
jgi:hypothetical protein